MAGEFCPWWQVTEAFRRKDALGGSSQSGSMGSGSKGLCLSPRSIVHYLCHIGLSFHICKVELIIGLASEDYCVGSMHQVSSLEHNKSLINDSLKK